MPRSNLGIYLNFFTMHQTGISQIQLIVQRELGPQRSWKKLSFKLKMDFTAGIESKFSQNFKGAYLKVS